MKERSREFVGITGHSKNCTSLAIFFHGERRKKLWLLLPESLCPKILLTKIMLWLSQKSISGPGRFSFPNLDPFGSAPQKDTVLKLTLLDLEEKVKKSFFFFRSKRGKNTKRVRCQVKRERLCVSLSVCHTTRWVVFMPTQIDVRTDRQDFIELAGLPKRLDLSWHGSGMCQYPSINIIHRTLRPTFSQSQSCEIRPSTFLRGIKFADRRVLRL